MMKLRMGTEPPFQAENERTTLMPIAGVKPMSRYMGANSVTRLRHRKHASRLSRASPRPGRSSSVAQRQLGQVVAKQRHFRR